MEIVPQLISRYSIVLYAVCGIACAYFLLTGVASLRELRRAIFRLERNAVVSRAISSLLKASGCLLIGVGIFAITAITPAPARNSLTGSVTSTPANLAIPTSMPTAVISTSQAMLSANFTPTITFADGSGNVTTTVAASAALTNGVPASAPELVADCSNANAQITSPGPDEQVIGAYALRGIAVLEAGGSFRLEILMPGSAQWAFLGRGDSTVNGGVLLNNFNAGKFPPGKYPIRLVLMGADGNVRAICRVPITISS